MSAGSPLVIQAQRHLMPSCSGIHRHLHLTCTYMPEHRNRHRHAVKNTIKTTTRKAPSKAWTCPLISAHCAEVQSSALVRGEIQNQTSLLKRSLGLSLRGFCCIEISRDCPSSERGNSSGMHSQAHTSSWNAAQLAGLKASSRHSSAVIISSGFLVSYRKP